jgi:hypothetical protein
VSDRQAVLAAVGGGVVLGAVLRWAAWPSVVAYRLGIEIGHMEQARKRQRELDVAYRVIGRLNRKTAPEGAR